MIGAKPLSDDEIRLIRAALVNPRDQALFVLNLYTGFRISEALSLKVSDVVAPDFKTLLPRVQVKRCNMKGKVSSRTVVLHPIAGAVLLAYINSAGLTQSDHLFRSKKGGAINRQQAWSILKTAVRSLGMDERINTHSPRKTFAKKVYHHFERDLIKTAKALGHRSVLSTVSYLSFETEEVDSAILGME